MSWEKISTPDQFPNLGVFKRDGTDGAQYSVSFCHQEFSYGWRGFLALAGVLVLLAVIIMGFVWKYVGVALLSMFGLPLWGLYIKEPWWTDRRIVLDYGSRTFRVLRKETVELERSLLRLANLTVEDHPDAEYERMHRLEKGERGLSKEERQHCLIGWFGEGGAEKVILVTRAEWPTRHSLLEVRQAIMWAIQKAAGPGAPDLVKGGSVRAGSVKGGGMAPPLD